MNTMNKVYGKRVYTDRIARVTMQMLTWLLMLTLVLMAIGLYMKSRNILEEHSWWNLISKSAWNPLNGEFGFLTFIVSSLSVTAVALLLSFPVSLLMALFLTEKTRPWIQRMAFPVLDILSGIPSVVYGLWGTLVVVPWIADKLGPHFVEYTSGYTWLAGSIVLAIMIVPLMVSLFVELFSTIPQDLRDASLALGATEWQTMKHVVLRKSLPGIGAIVALAVSKAFGETLAVLMVCGNMVGLPHSLFDSVYPLPALIANNYGEMLSLPMYESALMFAALLMFVIILVFNAAARIILQNIEKSISL